MTSPKAFHAIDAHAVDVHVGRRLREKRILSGFSQDALGREAGVTFQQVQKYERGMNRISAGKLYCFSRILEEPVGFFFAGLPGEAPRAREDGVPLDRETLEFMRSYFSIEDPSLRKHIKTLLKTLSAPPKG
jgi:transcriptional regulator with XRE-family HTH domain